MRNLIIILSLLIFQNGFAQTKSKTEQSVQNYTITKAKLAEVKLLTDIIPDIPANFSFLQFEIAFKSNGVIKVLSGSGIEFKSESLQNLKQATGLSKIYIDLKMHIDKKSINKSYVFLVQE